MVETKESNLAESLVYEEAEWMVPFLAGSWVVCEAVE